ncbi:MAG: diaminopimelate decarboxylase [Bacillota bacterium]|nr:diaminopimelate decarboxylase [Bacillota bacterium]
MNNNFSNVSDEQRDFLYKLDLQEIVDKYGSPLYLYDERTLRKRCEEMRGLIKYPQFSVNYSIKANSNIELLKIVKEEGINADAMSPGEIYVLLKAGFRPDQIFYIGNNVSAEEMQYAIDHGVLVSVDSISQLETYGKIHKGGKVAVRFNAGIGAGHHEKVVTAGSKTKFGIDNTLVEEVKNIADKYALKIVGVNQHIGSLFLDGRAYLEGVKGLLAIASKFPELEFIDLGGGFGIPYKGHMGEGKLDLLGMSIKLDAILKEWMKQYGRNAQIKIEPGRYIVAECGTLLGTVHSVKTNYNTKYIGTDIGFNVLMRPVMYDSYHEIKVFRNGKELDNSKGSKATVVGNICETGDILARDRELPDIEEGDIIAVLDAGAYGYSMSSNYNMRLRPAEAIICKDGSHKLIRKRDTLEALLSGF